MSGGEAVCQDAVQRVLHACQALGRVIILVVDVQVVVADGIQHFLAQQIVVYKWFGGLAGELHHHACRSVGIHVGVLAGDVVGFDVDDFQKHIARLCLAGDTALVAVGNVFLCDIFTAALHQLHFHQVLNGFHRHLGIALKGDVVGDLAYQLHVFSLVRMEHGLADGGYYFFFVEADDASVTLEYRLYHIGCIF